MRQNSQKKPKKPVYWKVWDPCACHGCINAGLSDVHNIADLQELTARAGELWGAAPGKPVGVEPSAEEQITTKATRLTRGMGRWLSVQRLWKLRRLRQRLRAQCMARDIPERPEKGGWGRKSLPQLDGSTGAWYFMRGAECVRGREEMSSMLF